MTDLRPENVPLPADQAEGPRHAPQPSRYRDGTGRPLPVLWLLSRYPRTEGHPLGVGATTVGRHPDNDVVLPSRYVSRRHCVIRTAPDGSCVIHDLGSAVGVYVDGQRV